MASSRANLLRLCHSDPFRTPLRRCRKTVRISAGTLSELNRNGVRNGSQSCPIKIVEVSENRRNTQRARTSSRILLLAPRTAAKKGSSYNAAVLAVVDLPHLAGPVLERRPAGKMNLRGTGSTVPVQRRWPCLFGEYNCPNCEWTTSQHVRIKVRPIGLRVKMAFQITRT
jgi:hypothetical protein